MVSNLATEGIKVEIYDRQDELIKTYYVGGAPPDERGTYMMLEGFEQPYVAHIPGWDGNLRFRYNLVGDEWRSRILFPGELEEIESVSIAYPRQRSKSSVEFSEPAATTTCGAHSLPGMRRRPSSRSKWTR